MSSRFAWLGFGNAYAPGIQHRNDEGNRTSGASQILRRIEIRPLPSPSPRPSPLGRGSDQARPSAWSLFGSGNAASAVPSPNGEGQCEGKATHPTCRAAIAARYAHVTRFSQMRLDLRFTRGAHLETCLFSRRLSALEKLFGGFAPDHYCNVCYELETVPPPVDACPRRRIPLACGSSGLFTPCERTTTAASHALKDDGAAANQRRTT